VGQPQLGERAGTDGHDARPADFDAFYAASRDRLVVQVAALTGDPADAADHVQEAFVRAWSCWSRVGGLDDPEGWVRRVAHNLAVSRWRRARRLVLGGLGDERSTAWDDTQLDVLAALRTLPRREREAVALHHLADLSVEDVARELGAPVGSVKSWLSRGRARLGTVLRTEDDDE